MAALVHITGFRFYVPKRKADALCMDLSWMRNGREMNKPQYPLPFPYDRVFMMERVRRYLYLDGAW